MFIFGYLIGSRRRHRNYDQNRPEGRLRIEWIIEAIAFVIAVIILYG